MLLTKLKKRDERLAYAASAVEHGWSRKLLTHHIELGTVERTGKAITNFAERLPKPFSDLARESIKDPYRFDFLSLGARPTSASSKTRWSGTSRGSSSSSAQGSRMSGARCRSRSTDATSSSTCSSTICVFAASSSSS